MSPDTGEKKYTTGEEIAHAITHGLGLLLSVAACSVLVILAAQRGNIWHITGVAVFGPQAMESEYSDSNSTPRDATIQRWLQLGKFSVSNRSAPL